MSNTKLVGVTQIHKEMALALIQYRDTSERTHYIKLDMCDEVIKSIHINARIQSCMQFIDEHKYTTVYRATNYNIGTFFRFDWNDNTKNALLEMLDLLENAGYKPKFQSDELLRSVVKQLLKREERSEQWLKTVK